MPVAGTDSGGQGGPVDRPRPVGLSGPADRPGPEAEPLEPYLGVARDIFGPRFGEALAYARLLSTEAVIRGLIGPREVGRIWDRHILNCAAVAELIPPGSIVLDIGSGAGLPGVPLALARPDLSVTLVEPLARRVAFLELCLTELTLPNVKVVRGRAATVDGGVADVVTARAVAPLGDLAEMCLPLVRPGGVLLAIKGASAHGELLRDRAALEAAGGNDPEVVQLYLPGVGVPTTVVRIRRR